MATSGSTDFSVTRDQIIAGALRIVGATAQGETATATQVSEAAEALNMMAKAWQADGMPLWAIKQYSLTLTATTSYRIGLSQTVNTAKPLKLIQAFIRTTASTTDVPLNIITRDEYNRLGNKTTTGVPSQVYYDVQRTYGDLYVFPTPDATVAAAYTITLVYQRPYEDFDASTDDPDFPQEWFDALKWGLADRVAPEYGLALQERQDIRSRAQQTKQEALLFGSEEGSFYFQPDMRNW